MIGKIFLLTACCCASLLSVSASDETQDTSLSTLHYEMKQVANYIKFLTNEDNRDYLEEKFKKAKMAGEGSLKALSAFVENLDVLKEEVPFETSLFDAALLKDLEIQDPDDVFKSLLERVPLIKSKLIAFNAFLHDNPQRIMANQDGEMTKYYKEHISKEDVKVKDYTFLVKFCNDFLDDESPFMKMYKALKEYDELVNSAPAHSPSPTHSSPQGTTTTQPSQDSAAPNTSAESSSGNLNGQPSKSAETPKPTGSSFTFGGLTVATLCYFVLSAF
uniref:Merozoite surface antigen 2a/b T-2 n=1 Tax=Babesia bovis TaxID=5865 RepID=Q3LUQ4_BABBO|nr:merozoite surface antigen 2a/b T-2 [Babesia bovis]